MSRRTIIKIDEDKCDGCGECIVACAEGALEIVDGKARLVSDRYCDGLGACLGECPQGAISMIEREAAAFDEEAVHARLSGREAEAAATIAAGPESLASGCPGSMAQILTPAAQAGAEQTSQLSQWPIQLQLLNPEAPFLLGSDLILVADCTAVAYANLHSRFIKGHTIAMACPKLDDMQAHVQKLVDILRSAHLNSLTILHMEVPCCGGIVRGAQMAVQQAGVDLPVRSITIARDGSILQEGLI